jgi:hypothetical protein
MRLLPGGQVEQAGDRCEGVLRNAEIGRPGSKSREMARTAMPQLCGLDTATGE